MKAYLLAVSVAVVGAAAFMVGLPGSADVDPIVSGSIKRDGGAIRTFSVSNISDKSACIVERGAALTSRSRAFNAPADCDSVWPGLASAKNWTENEDGSVVLSTTSGEAVLTVMNSDGVSYQAMEPAGAAITLLATE